MTHAGFQSAPTPGGYENADSYNRTARFSYGGKPGQLDTDGNYIAGTNGADAATARFQQMGGAAAGRQGPIMATGYADTDRGLGMGSRADEQGVGGIQGQNIDMMRQAAMGQVPSAAEGQLAEGRDQSINSALALAASTRGGPQNFAAAGRQAADQNAQTMQATNQQAAVLRAQEQAQARQGLMGATGQLADSTAQRRAQDLQAQGLDAQTAYQQAQLELGQRQLNDSTQLGYENLGQGAQEDQLNANQGLDTSEEAHWKAQMAQDEDSKKDSQSLVGKAASMAGAVVGGIGDLFSDMRAKTDIAPADSASAGRMAQMGINVAPPPTAQQVVDAKEATAPHPGFLHHLGGMLQSMGGAFRDQPPPQAASPRYSSDEDVKVLARQQVAPSASSDPQSGPATKMMGSGLDVMGTEKLFSDDATRYGRVGGSGGYSSDERVKTGIHPSTADMFLDTLKPFDYRYKNPAQEPAAEPTGGRYLGVMAQNVERAPAVGAQLVKNTPTGKVIETPAMVSALAAGEGRLHERVSRLERMGGRRG